MLSNFVKARENKDCLMDLVEKMPQPEITTLLLLIKPKMKEILISSHKFCQKFFERLRPEERVCVLKEILPFFVVISLNKWGSISLQALISFITLPEEEDLLLQSVRGNVSKLALNKYSNFVIQKLTQKISGAKLPLWRLSLQKTAE